MTTRRTILVTTAVIGAVSAGFAPAFAADAHRTPKPLHGTFSYLDTTPDPTVVANNDAASHCHGNLPSSPADVNSHTIKIKGPGTLTVVGHNRLDWAMEVRDSHGVVLAGSDGGTPQAAEGTVVSLHKAGAYAVVFCSAEGEPTITADYTYKYR